MTGFRAPVAALICVLMGACAQSHPEKACVDPAIHETLRQMIFEQADRAIDSFAADHEVQDPAGLKAQLKKLAAQQPIAFEAAALEGYDKVTMRSSCSITIDYKLQSSDKTPAGKVAMEQIHGLDAPNDLLGDGPKSLIKFTVQPSAEGAGSVVAFQDAHEPASAMLLIAMTRKRRLPGSEL